MPFTDQYDSLSALDARYWQEKLVPYLSENAFVEYKLRVELAIVTVLAKYGLCPQSVVQEVYESTMLVTTAQVYEEEAVTRHDIIALVHMIQANMSEEAAPYVHRMATSYDIIDTANAMRYRDMIKDILVPGLIELQRVLIDITVREAATPQIGRTHLQHAIPITFGFAIAEFVSRIGGCIEAVQVAADNLKGKFSGPVGAYNATTLLLTNGISPLQFEADVMAELGLSAGEYSKQTVMPEPLARLLAEVVILAGALANLAQDMRILQATEIAEVVENFTPGQGGSSAMPQKKNPITSENTLSMYKIVMPRIFTVFMDLVSDFQRDLSNSASGRTYGEMFAYVAYMVERMTKSMSKLEVKQDKMLANLLLQNGIFAAEPLQNLLAMQGCPNAYDVVQAIAMECRDTGKPFPELIAINAVVAPYLENISVEQRRMLTEPAAYIGLAHDRAIAIARKWKTKLGINSTT